MTKPPYPKAPITEAVIEIKFKTALDASDIDKVRERLASAYPQHQNVQSFNVAVQLLENQPDAPTTKIERTAGHRLASVDMTELLLLWESAFVISQLAPYPGWDSFLRRFVRDWAVWKRIMGYREVSRVGVRYINRIDIPATGPVVPHEAFLNVYPKLPEILSVVNAYAVQAVMGLEDIRCKLTLNSAAVDSPILGHSSFLFDQDIAREVDPPQSDEAIIDLLNKIRVQKNKVFEACITDRARELFAK
jgi:uncharacterized protein (TIGR04255 family)